MDGANEAEPEAGGRDQVLLPKDAGIYDVASKTIRNAVVDNELGAALDRIRAKGATVWVIIDACHAGTVTRSGETTRGIDPSALLVPDAARSLPSTQPSERHGTLRSIDEKGALVGFFAVDSWTEAIERAYPDAPADLAGVAGQHKFGVFTWHLLRALQSNRAHSFRDLARQVSLDMAASARLNQVPLPVFQGDLDRGLMGAVMDAARFPARAAGSEIVIDAGPLAGFDEGSNIELFDGPLADSRSLGMATVVSTGAGESLARPDGTEAAARLPADLWVRLRHPGLTLRYRVDANDDSRVANLVTRALQAQGDTHALAVDLVEPGASADLRIARAEDRVWFVPQGTKWIRETRSYGRSFSIPLTADDAQMASMIRNAVWTFVRATNLVRIASVADSAETADNQSIDVKLDRFRETDPARLADPTRRCQGLSRPSDALPVSSGTAAALSHCDMVRLTIFNRSEHDVDLGIFLLDPLGGIDVPVRDWRQNGCIATLPAKASGPMVIRTTLRTWANGAPSQIGLHRILVFALPRHGGIPPSLCHLLQPDLAAARAGAEATRNAGGQRGFITLLRRAALAEPGLRSANPFEDETSERDTIVVRQFSIDLRQPDASR